jgi:cytochrome c oxidase subunit 4
MSTTAAPMAHEETVHGTGHAHPTDGNYMVIALILAIITAGEVSLYYIDVGKAMIPTLLVMMVLKFAIVVAYFMHLKFDSLIFRRLFVSGLILAVAVYLAAMTSMQLFGDDTVRIQQSGNTHAPVQVTK